jgi:hypothetical protein
MKKRVMIKAHTNMIIISRPLLLTWNEYPDISGKNRKNIMAILDKDEYEPEETRSSTGQLLFTSWFVGKN